MYKGYSVQVLNDLDNGIYLMSWWLAIGTAIGFFLFLLWRRVFRVPWYLRKLVKLRREGSEAILPIIRILPVRDQHGRIRQAAVAALTEIGSASILGLRDVLWQGKEDVRQAAAFALGAFQHPTARAALIQALQDTSVSVRGTAATALGTRGDTESVQPLMKVLEHSHAAWQQTYAELIQDGFIGGGRPSTEIKRLKSMVGVNRLRKRMQALSYCMGTTAVALGQIGHPQAVPMLINVLSETRLPLHVRKAITEALQHFGPAVAPALVQAWREAWGDGSQILTDVLVDVLVTADPVFKPLSAPLLHAMLAFHPTWVTAYPSAAEFAAFRQRVAWLPPFGGKIPLTIEGRVPKLLRPSWSAEEQVEKLLQLRQRGQLGRGYVHQVSVQGRLPDDFKYVALALVISSPYPHDWMAPFFEAPWGKVAPLIHDGGMVQVGLNPLWQGVPGRTDFLQRVVMVYEPALEQLERLSEAEQLQRLTEDPRLIEHYHRECEERVRLVREAKAYQRLALALHAAAGTAPNAMPEAMREKLEGHWHRFRERMDNLLGEFDVRDAADIRWFTEQARRLDGWFSPRHEADWEPIQQRLVRLEAIKKQYPPLRSHVIQLLQQATEAIDRDLGFVQSRSERGDAGTMWDVG